MAIDHSGSERRQFTRFDKVFTVFLKTEEGTLRGIARNMSATGLYVELSNTPLLRSKVLVTFTDNSGSEMTALCEVRYQVAINTANVGEHIPGTRGVGLRILSWETLQQSTKKPVVYH